MTQIKVGYAKIDNPKQLGFSFDNYIFHKLKEYGLTPTRDCCGKSHLMLKTGTTLYAEYNSPNEGFYNLEKWLRRSLIQLGVMTQAQIDALCCPTKNTLFLHTNIVYFGKKDLKNNTDLKKRLKKLLTDWSVTYTDPCCNSVFKKYVVFAYDFVDPQLYTDLSTASCNAFLTTPDPTQESHNLTINGVQYINTPYVFPPNTATLATIKAYYESLNVPGVTYSWVAADTGLYAEPFANTSKKSNVAYLVVIVPPTVTSVIGGYKFKSVFPVTTVTNLLVTDNMIFNTSNC